MQSESQFELTQTMKISFVDEIIPTKQEIFEHLNSFEKAKLQFQNKY